jgi:hypothetical protein
VEKIIQQEHTFIQTIIEGVRDPARIVSPDFEVQMMNQAALAILPSRQAGQEQLPVTRLIDRSTQHEPEGDRRRR